MPYKALEQQRQFQATWIWRRRMQWIIENGPCVACGSSQDLRVVYKDPTEKKVRVTSIWSLRDEKRAELLAKCIVLCRECAIDKQRVERKQPEHGTANRYNQGCRCVPCRTDKAVKRAAERARAKERAMQRR